MRCKQIGSLALVLILVLSVGGAALASGERTTLGVIDIAGAAEIIEGLAPGLYEVMLFPTMNETLMALKSGRVEGAQAIEDYANFLMKTDDSLQYERMDVPQSPLGMLTRAADAELTTAINDAILAMKESGTLEALHQQYVTDASPDNIPQAPAPQTFAGAREVIVGVSGDFPPHDYISAAGDPAGFNVALMQEIAALAGFNVKYETVAFGSKFAALESGRIDLFFLHAGHTSFEGIVQTEAYDEGVYVGVLTLK